MKTLVAAQADVALQCNPHGKFSESSDALFRAAGTAQYETVEWLIKTQSFNPLTKSFNKDSYYDAAKGCCLKTKHLLGEWSDQLAIQLPIGSGSATKWKGSSWHTASQHDSEGRWPTWPQCDGNPWWGANDTGHRETQSWSVGKPLTALKKLITWCSEELLYSSSALVNMTFFEIPGGHIGVCEMRCLAHFAMRILQMHWAFAMMKARVCLKINFLRGSFFEEACHNGSAHGAPNLARSLLHDGKPGARSLLHDGKPGDVHRTTVASPNVIFVHL